MRRLLMLLLVCLTTYEAHAQFGFVQLIHNAHDAGPVDVYVDDARLLDDLDFRTATPFLAVLHGTHTVDIVDGDASDNSTALWTGTLSIVADRAYAVVAYGAASDLQLAVANNVQREAQTSDAAFFIVHSAPGLGAVDLRLLDLATNSAVIGLLANNIDEGEISSYQQRAPEWYAIEITSADGRVHHDAFFLDLRRFEGQSFVLTLSSLGTSGAGSFNLMSVADDGSVSFGQIENPFGVANEEDVELPTALVLHGNAPNPFHRTTNIRFAVARQAVVRLTVYDMLGRAVAHLLNETLPAGQHTLPFDAASLPSGVYIYQFQAGHEIRTKRLVRLP